MKREELIDLINECIEKIEAKNTTVVEEGKKVSIPADMKITVEDIEKASVFKRKVLAVVKYLEDNGADKKTISKNIVGMYYAVLGTTFANGVNSAKPYQPKVEFLAKLLKKYPEKSARVKKDISKTIAALEKKDNLTALQKAWLNDIEKAAKVLG